MAADGFDEFLRALRAEMKRVKQKTSDLRVARDRQSASLPMPGRRRYVIKAAHMVEEDSTPEEMASAVYAVYLSERAGEPIP